MGAMDWLSLANPPHWARSRWLGAALGGCISLLLVWVIALVVSALVAMSGALLFPGAAPAATADLRGVAVFTTAALSAPFIIWRTIVASRQNDLQAEALAQDKAAATRSLFNDKINAATVELAARRQVTRVVKNAVDDPEVVITEWDDDMVRRAAGIDRLEGLAKEQLARIRRTAPPTDAEATPHLRSTDELTEEEHEALDEALRIAKLLCTYVKELSVDYPAEKMLEGVSDQELTSWVHSLTVKRRDAERAVQSLAAINASVRKTFANAVRVIDLRDTNLQSFNLKGQNLERAYLRGAHLQGASLAEAQLGRADLMTADMQGATLVSAKMQNTQLDNANLDDAMLLYAQMQGASLTRTTMKRAALDNAQLQGAFLAFANMQGTSLNGARMYGAHLTHTRLMDTDLSNAHLQGAGLSDLVASEINCIGDNFAELFSDASLTLPDGITRPDWPDLKLGFEEFIAEWGAWKALGPSGYVWADRRKYYTADGVFSDLGPPVRVEGDWLETVIHAAPEVKVFSFPGRSGILD